MLVGSQHVGIKRQWHFRSSADISPFPIGILNQFGAFSAAGVTRLACHASWGVTWIRSMCYGCYDVLWECLCFPHLESDDRLSWGKPCLKHCELGLAATLARPRPKAFQYLTNKHQRKAVAWVSQLARFNTRVLPLEWSGWVKSAFRKKDEWFLYQNSNVVIPNAQGAFWPMPLHQISNVCKMSVNLSWHSHSCKANTLKFHRQLKAVPSQGLCIPSIHMGQLCFIAAKDKDLWGMGYIWNAAYRSMLLTVQLFDVVVRFDAIFFENCHRAWGTCGYVIHSP